MTTLWAEPVVHCTAGLYMPLSIPACDCSVAAVLCLNIMLPSLDSSARCLDSRDTSSSTTSNKNIHLIGALHSNRCRIVETYASSTSAEPVRTTVTSPQATQEHAPAALLLAAFVLRRTYSVMLAAAQSSSRLQPVFCCHAQLKQPVTTVYSTQ